ncbi:hypothetical protein MNVM_21350 [Mycobacterium novum]|uniref:Uncharacterized protein n=1 Tax=Mycobacterium novum TaxID=2492438 RepID=A0A7I7JP87_9MYCO|nr:hypothetical protein [Mycobacterium novum]BBX13054.1 hypothetical protein MNVM_21350 [Mycobacterium novum]
MKQLDNKLPSVFVADFAGLVAPREFRQAAANAYRTLDPGVCTFDEFLDRLTEKVQARRQSLGMEPI